MGNKNIMIISLIFGIVTFFITTLYLGNISKEQKFKSELLNVVVAKINIPSRTVLTKEVLEFKAIPREYVLPGAALKQEDVLEKVSVTPLIPGEQLTASKLTVRNKQLGLALIIPKDKRAVSVEVDASASIAGLIKPGDMVDVVCTLMDMDRTVTILQDVPILAIDQQMESSAATNGKINSRVIATFALDLSDSEKLIHASSKGQLKLLLRPINDDSKGNSYGATVYKLLPYVPYTGKGNVDSGYKVRIIKGLDVTSKSF